MNVVTRKIMSFKNISESAAVQFRLDLKRRLLKEMANENFDQVVYLMATETGLDMRYLNELMA